ncbi:MAG: hypothetical protein HQL41_03775 [Alphaproteobacteria bacterium]|nr:hypothetical protein [Alphaproteobacteria bacterium]
MWRRPSVLIGGAVLLVLSWAGDLLLVAFLLAVALLFFVGAVQGFRQARVAADTPTSTIRGAAQGRVELNVRIPVDKPLTAPLSGDECGFWHLEVERVVGRGRDARRKVIAEAWSGGKWQEVTDSTGICLLAMPEARITSTLSDTRTIIGGGLGGLEQHFSPDARPALDAFAEKIITERRFPVDASLHVIGLFESLASNRTPFDDDWTDRVSRQAGASPGWARKLAALTQEATADERERLKETWRTRMRELEGIPEGAPLGGTVVVHTMRRDFRQNRVIPLLISDQEENAVIGSLRRGAVGALAAGFVVTAMAVGTLAYLRPDLWDALMGG